MLGWKFLCRASEQEAGSHDKKEANRESKSARSIYNDIETIGEVYNILEELI